MKALPWHRFNRVGSFQDLSVGITVVLNDFALCLNVVDCLDSTM